jgi:hypothetical protein
VSFLPTTAMALVIGWATVGICDMSEKPDSQVVTLTIHTGKAHYKVGEDIDLEVKLSNAGPNPVNVLKFFMLPADDPGKNNLEIQVRDAGGNLLSRVSEVLTGRALYFPDGQTLNPGETCTASFRLAGTFVRPEERDKHKEALWSLGENPEVYSSDYPAMAGGTFSVQAIYKVGEQQWEGFRKANDASLWTGQLVSNTIVLSVE